MSYIKPELVLSPKSSVSELEVIYDGGEKSWAIAKMKWDEEETIGLRWNGNSKSPVGNPQSRGVPTWFILPKEIADATLNMLKFSKKISS